MNKLCLAALALYALNLHAQQCDVMHGKVVINEVCPFNTSIATNSIGLYEDYVELFNNTSQAINLQGHFLSDRRGNRTKYEFPNVSIPANGFLIVWCDGVGDPDQAGLNASFSLSSSEGERVVFSNPDTVIIDFVKYGPMAENISIGRFPNGTGPFTTMIPSFNAFNFNGDNFGLVINEYMARNSSTVQDPFGGFDDWIEIYNNSLTFINLNNYYLSDNSGTPTKFKFPNMTIGPNQYLIVWADNESFQGPMHADFGLSGSGEEVILSNPDTLTIDYFRFGPQSQNISEARSPNGFGRITGCMAPTFAAPNGGLVSATAPESSAEILMFPNPSRQFVTIKSPMQKPQPALLFDASGSLVLETILNPGPNQLDISGLPAGLYTLQTQSRRIKLVVQ